MESKIKFIIPNLYENYEQNIKFLTYFKEHPECFYDNIEIEAVYGNFQFCIWDGGRIFNSYRQSTKEEITSILCKVFQKSETRNHSLLIQRGYN